MKKRRSLPAYIPVLLLLIFVGPAQAGWIETKGMCPRAAAMGGAFTAVADTPSAWHYNPAGLAQIDGKQNQLGLTQVAFLNFFQRNPDSGLRSASKIPPFYSPLTRTCRDFGIENFTFGMGGGAPFAGGVRWSDKEGDMRFSSYEQMTILLTFTAAAAYKVTPWLMVGASLNMAALNKLSIKRKLGDGYVGKAAQAKAKELLGLNPNEPSPEIDTMLEFIGLDSQNGRDDGKLELWTDKEFPTGVKPYNDLDIDFRHFSYNLGILLQPAEKLRIGITYREQMSFTFEGHAQVVLEEDAAGIVNNNPLLVALNGPLNNESSRFNFDVTMPRIVVAGISYLHTDRLLFAADVQWTNWSAAWGVETINIEGEGLLGETSLVTNYGYRDTLSFRFGVEYILFANVACRAGYWYDPYAIPDETYITFDANRHVISFGIGYKGLFDGRLGIDTIFQFTHLESRLIKPYESENLGGMKNYESSYNDFPLEVGGHEIIGGLVFTYRPKEKNKKKKSTGS